MSLKLMGAVCILAGCGGCGFSIAAAYRREERELQGLLRAVETMLCELEYQLTPLPQLLCTAANAAGGLVGKFLSLLSQRLETNSEADPQQAMQAVLSELPGVPYRVELLLRQLGASLGKYALSGQTSALQSVRQLCQRDLQSLAQDRDARLRSYRTLGLCAGAALAILLL